MNSKKGALHMETVIVAALLLMVMVAVTIYLGRGQANVNSQTLRLELQAKTRACQAQAAVGGAFLDADFKTGGDGFPDGCEVCRGGDNSKDADADGIPDACDPDDNNAPTKTQELCEGTWDKARKQCTLNCYPSKC